MLYGQEMYHKFNHVINVLYQWDYHTLAISSFLKCNIKKLYCQRLKQCSKHGILLRAPKILLANYSPHNSLSKTGSSFCGAIDFSAVVCSLSEHLYFDAFNSALLYRRENNEWIKIRVEWWLLKVSYNVTTENRRGEVSPSKLMLRCNQNEYSIHLRYCTDKTKTDNEKIGIYFQWMSGRDIWLYNSNR